MEGRVHLKLSQAKHKGHPMSLPVLVANCFKLEAVEYIDTAPAT